MRRTLLVLVAYAAGAWVVLLVGGWLRRVLSLPPLFEQLLHGGLLLGVVVAALMAWNYPRLAVGAEGPYAGEGTDRRTTGRTGEGDGADRRGRRSA